MIVYATVTDPDGNVREAVPIVVGLVAGVASYLLDDGTLIELDEAEISGALYALAHGLGEAA